MTNRSPQTINGHLVLDNIFDPIPGNEAPADDLYTPLMELYSTSIVKQSEVIGMMADLCTWMEMKTRQDGAIMQDWKVQSYTSRYFSRCQYSVNVQDSSLHETDANIVKRGAIVVVRDGGEQEYYHVLAVYAKHYNKYWLADERKRHKKDDQRLLICQVKMHFNSSNVGGRFEDIIPNDHTQA